MKKVNGKRILAWFGIVFLVGLYVVTFVSALLSKPYANGMFLTSVFCSFMIPLLIYGFMVVGKAFGKKTEDSISLRELHEMKKKLKQEDGKPDHIN